MPDAGYPARGGSGSGPAQRLDARGHASRAGGLAAQSLTLEQASALLAEAEKSRLRAYICLCLLTGVRSEEARALTWQHVDLEAGTVSVRARRDTKTDRVRTLKLAVAVSEALRVHRGRQTEDRAMPSPCGSTAIRVHDHDGHGARVAQSAA